MEHDARDLALDRPRRLLHHPAPGRILLPAALALITGRVPQRLRSRLAPTRPRGWALFALYLAAPLNAVRRLAGASPGLTLAATAAAGTLAVTGCVGAALAAHRATRAAA
ncbi:hypothetical protein [Streptomyces sp. SCL15-6]|uniref:hypothetical protein n=1 Tax=Streptomyces sp. SCL15-6 TaxID=2967222 RepID=UPI0029664A36|nr:hypothetical protein [Streptomyces sp. SCL15-6]